MAEEQKQTFYGTGRRKKAIAKVWLRPGTGKIEVNKKPMEELFTRIAHRQTITAPLKAVEMEDKVDVRAVATGGGVSGQADSVRLGIARALVDMDENMRPTLAKQSLLTRDPRMPERKKYGQPGARKRFQYSKR